MTSPDISWGFVAPDIEAATRRLAMNHQQNNTVFYIFLKYLKSQRNNKGC